MTSRHLLYTLAFVWHVINESLWGQNQSQQSIIMYTYFHFFYSLACCKVSAKQRRCHLFWISTGLEGSSWLLPKSIRKDMGGISLWFCWFQKSIMTEQMFNKKKKTCPILYFALKNVLHNLSLVPILLFFHVSTDNRKSAYMAYMKPPGAKTKYHLLCVCKWAPQYVQPMLRSQAKMWIGSADGSSSEMPSRSKIYCTYIFI